MAARGRVLKGDVYEAFASGPSPSTAAPPSGEGRTLPLQCVFLLMQINSLLIPSLSGAEVLILAWCNHRRSRTSWARAGNAVQVTRAGAELKQVCRGDVEVGRGRLAPGRDTPSNAAPELFAPT